jgi:enamine deaminase RidA (YjgF/YER057c/UK114 family)
VSDIKRINVDKRLSDVAIHNGVVYLAGQVADTTTKDIRGQTAEVLATIDRLLEQAGSDKTRLLQVQIFLSDIANFAGMNEIWDAWVPQGHTPPRATVESRLATPAYLVEIKVIAAQR